MYYIVTYYKVMNRIRKYKSGYQALVTPHQQYNTGFEFMLGSWTDEGLSGFRVYTYDTYYDAECRVGDSPDINWDQLIDFHKDQYYFFKREIEKVINFSSMAVDFESHLMSPKEAKDKMFDRVLKGQSRGDSSFRLVNDMNDIISYVIVNPYSANLREMELRLTKQSRLNIFRRMEKNKIIHLIGRTDIGTTYEIVLCPSIIHNWMKWKNIANVDYDEMASRLRNAIELQKTIDSTLTLR